jgi:hypothetical protein
MAWKGSFCGLLAPQRIILLEETTQQTLLKSSVFRNLARYELTVKFQRKLTCYRALSNSAIRVSQPNDY